MSLRAASIGLALALGGCVSGPPLASAPEPAPSQAAPVAPIVSAIPPPATARRAEPSSLTVTVKGIGPEKSRLLVGLFDEARYKTKKPPFNRDGPAKAPETTVTFENLKPGRYAVKTMQDMNGNNDMDMTLLGFPKEPFGFSNDVKPVVGEPGFRQTSFEVKPGANAITIHLQRM